MEVSIVKGVPKNSWFLSKSESKMDDVGLGGSPMTKRTPPFFPGLDSSGHGACQAEATSSPWKFPGSSQVKALGDELGVSPREPQGFLDFPGENG